MAAADAAKRQGARVALFERSGVLGGRVASLFEPTQKQWIDIGQHLFLGCCSSVLAFNKRLGLDPFFERFDTIPFATCKQQHWSLAASSFFPQRLQLLPSFLKMPLLPFAERFKTGLLLKKLSGENLPDITMTDWFKRHRVSQHALEAFWLPFVLSTLSEMPDTASAKALQAVLREGLAGREGLSIHLPMVPLRKIYHETASAALEEQGVSLQFFKRLRRIYWNKNDDGSLTITTLEFSDGTFARFDRYILAMPSFQLWKVLEASALALGAEKLGLERFEPGAITTVHLWLDRPLLQRGGRFEANGTSDRTYCVLSGGIGQFLCASSDVENYYTVVISAAHRLLSDEEMTMRGNLAERILEQLRATFGIPALQLKHSRITTCFEAVFSPKPEIYARRPDVAGLFTNGMIAGDWTQTGFPATMEGAVRSGLSAVEALAVL